MMPAVNTTTSAKERLADSQKRWAARPQNAATGATPSLHLQLVEKLRVTAPERPQMANIY
jgi:hypothetical protein